MIGVWFRRALLAFGFAVPVWSANVAPLYFEGLADDSKHQEYWEDLMKYKLWGTRGLAFSNNKVYIRDAVGYNGTAKGDLFMRWMDHVIGGPFLIGGNYEIEGGQRDTMIGGPTRIDGNVYLKGNKDNYAESSYEGAYCVSGSMEEFSSDPVTSLEIWKNSVTGGVYDFASCPETVPNVDRQLYVPTLPEPSNGWEEALRFNATIHDECTRLDLCELSHATVNSSTRSIFFHIPPKAEGAKSDDMYDLYVSALVVSGIANPSIYFVMEPGGRLTRIFARDGISFAGVSNPKVQVAYVPKGTKFNETTQKWDLKDSANFVYVDDKDYSGNLMFYSAETIALANGGNSRYQGSFISMKPMTIGFSFTLAGQFISDSLAFGGDITGEFRYVPFDPPWLGDPEAKGWGIVREDVSGKQNLSVSLSKEPSTDVNFKYCFAFKGDASKTHSNDSLSAYLASASDIVANIPICTDGKLSDTTSCTNGMVTYSGSGKFTGIGEYCSSGNNYGTAGFAKGSSTLSTPISVEVVNDKDWEWTERFYIRIFDLEGAVAADGSRSDEYYVEIIDDDGVPLSNDFALTGNEDESIAVKNFPAHRANGDTVKQFNVIVKTLPQKGTLALNGKAVKVNDKISYEDLENLTFVGASNEFSGNDIYSSFTYTLSIYETNQTLIAASTGKDTVYTLSFKLNPVNDRPTKIDTTFYTIAENSAAKTTAKGSIVVTDVDDYQFTYAFDKNDENYTKVAALFEISSEPKSAGNDTTNCVLSLKVGASLNYETADSVMTIKVIITDSAATTKGVGKTDTSVVLTIKIENVNESPVSENQTFAFDEHEQAGIVVDTVKWDDLDDVVKFRNNEVYALGGDTALFEVSKDGVIKTKKEFDFESEDTVYTLIVEVRDSADKKLSVIDTITINVQNVPEYPVVTSTGFPIQEHSADSTVIGVVASKDADDPKNVGKRVYSLVDSSDYVILDEDGTILVKDGALFDFEKLESFTIKVVVSDAEGNSSDPAEILISLIDVNEAPSLNDTTFVVGESEKKNVVVGKVVASDPDFKTKDYSTLSYGSIDGDTDVFAVTSNGQIILKGILDYEARTEYSLTVRVSDGELADTAVVTINVLNNPDEYTDVQIVKVENRDTIWNYPDTIYTNIKNSMITWTCSGVDSTFDTTYTEGKNVIVVSCKDPTKDHAGFDTLVVFFSSAAPIITVSANSARVNADNIFTVVETTDKSDTNIYVNTTLNDIYITVRDSFANKNDSFVVHLDIETFKDSDVKKELSTAERKAEVSIGADENGDYPTKAVIGYKGKVDTIEVMFMSYSTKIDGKDVTISYWADAITGTRVDTGEGDFFVSYDYKDEAGNVVNVSYAVDESGKIVSNKEGDVGYTVSYSYTNLYGNSTTQSVYITLDTKGPEVVIKSPVDGDIVYTSFVEVEWTVNGVVQDTLVVQGLEKGWNVIVRFYKDKAGNIGADTVYVIMKNAKDVAISLVEPVVEITEEKLEKYYGSNQPKEGQTFAVSIKNPTTHKEVETLIGGNFETEAGSGETPYPGVSDSSHFGPTLSLDIKLPSYSSIGGLATLDELIFDGKVYPEGVVAEGKGNEPMTVEEYVAEYCEDGFDYSDPSNSNLYNSKLNAKIWVYTTLGNFVDYFSFTQDMNDPSYANEAAVLKLYFEQKPDRDGFVRTENGRIYATGAYVYKVEANIMSSLRCDLPPLKKDSESGKRGTSRKDGPIKSSETLLKPFGYKRPNLK